MLIYLRNFTDWLIICQLMCDYNTLVNKTHVMTMCELQYGKVIECDCFFMGLNALFYSVL